MKTSFEKKQYHFRSCDLDICLLDRVPTIECYDKENCPYGSQKPLEVKT